MWVFFEGSDVQRIIHRDGYKCSLRFEFRWIRSTIVCSTFSTTHGSRKVASLHFRAWTHPLAIVTFQWVWVNVVALLTVAYEAREFALSDANRTFDPPSALSGSFLTFLWRSYRSENPLPSFLADFISLAYIRSRPSIFDTLVAGPLRPWQATLSSIAIDSDNGAVSGTLTDSLILWRARWSSRITRYNVRGSSSNDREVSTLKFESAAFEWFLARYM